MVSFARLLYPLQTIPLLLKHADIKNLNKAISKFLWRNKRPRIALAKLYLPRREGGISLPNIRTYNLSCLLRISLDWISQLSRCSNYSMEASMAQPYSLVALLHCRWKSIPPPIQHNLLLRDTAIAWREIRKALKLSPFMSRHLPIQGNPSFPPGLEYKPFTIWQQKGLTHFSTLCDLETGRPHNFSVIAETFSLPTSHTLHYAQCVSFIKDSCREESKRFQTSITDLLLHSDSYKISDIYKPFLIRTTPPLASSSVANWGKDFPDSDIVEKVLQGYQKTLQLTPNEVWRETQLKIMHRAYIPFISDKTVQGAANCPMCRQPKPSLSHRFWSCPFISTFWDQIISYIFKITLLKIPKDPLLLIFGYWDDQLLPWSPITHPTYKDWALISLLLARRLILQNWTSSLCPQISQLKRELLTLLHRDKLNTDFRKELPHTRFYSRWWAFMQSTLSQEELQNFENTSFAYYDTFINTPEEEDTPVLSSSCNAIAT